MRVESQPPAPPGTHLQRRGACSRAEALPTRMRLRAHAGAWHSLAQMTSLPPPREASLSSAWLWTGRHRR